METKLKKYILQLASELALPSTKIEDPSRIQLNINPKTSLLTFQDDVGFFIHAKISPVPKEKLEDLYLYLMRANFLFQGTGGNIIGMDGDDKFLTLSAQLPYDINYLTFKEKIEDFVNYLDYWKEQVSQHNDSLLEHS